MNTEFRVIPAGERHIEGIVQCRMRAFPDYFATLIGPAFIRASSQFYVSHPDGIVFVALTGEDRVVGVVAGGKPELRSLFTRKRLPRLAFNIIWAGIADSRARRRLAQHLGSFVKKVLVKLKLLKQEKLREPPPDPPGTWSSLLTVGADPDFRGMGIGSAVMQAFADESKKRGYRTMRLSVYNDNAAAIALYQKCGWETILRTTRGTYFKKTLEQD